MSNKTNGVKWNKSSKSKQRRKAVIERLEAQLKSNDKPEKLVRDGRSIISKMRVMLSKEDIARINKEIEILKQRI